ncbi:MAG: hypothetical protein OXB84_03560, partial [Halobacteriovoraceae bacterium]|nr:hypothetical protein [Halobacteriovoraceae bacterium]
MINTGLMGSLVINILIILAMILFGIIYSFFFPKVFSILAAFITYLFTAISKTYFPPEFLWSDIVSDLSLMKIISLLFHVFIPHLSSLNEISKQLISNGELSYNITWELIHFGISFSILFFLTKWILKKSG